MTTSIWFRDLLVYGLQSTLLIGAGAALARLFRLHDPKAALAYWRALLLVCLLLPVCQPWQKATTPAIDGIGILQPVGDAGFVTGARLPMRWDAWPIEAALLLALAAGMAARGVWLAGGALSLRRLRRTAAPLVPLPPAVRSAERRVGARADVRVSNEVAGPITFGARRPVIVVPPSVLALEEGVQEAIACHELLHVRRRDWLDEILEEVVRTILWFHPAVGWLIGRIQLSREQVVDRGVVELTQSRDRYVDALMAVAFVKTRIAMAPAQLFLRRKLLKSRIASLFQETAMSKPRLIVSLGVCAATLVVAASVAVRLFPLQARGQDSAVPPVQIVAGGDHLLHASLPEYPRRAIELGVEGDVLLEISVDDQGRVSDARVLAGPDELRKAALASVLDWHFAPAAVRSAVTQATLRFHLPSAANVEYQGRGYAVMLTPQEGEKGELTPAQRAERLKTEIEKALEDPTNTESRMQELRKKYEEVVVPVEVEGILTKRAQGDEPGERIRLKRQDDGPFDGTPILAQIRSERVPAEALKDLVGQLGIRIGDPITEDTAKRIRQAVARFDEHLRVAFQGDGKGRMTIVILAP